MNTLKERFIEASKTYQRFSEHEKERALQKPNDSNIQYELLATAKFNEGRAEGFREALEYLEQFIG